MWLVISYKSICRTFDKNANVIEKEIKKKIMTYWFFILYNNINFYEYICDACIFNSGAQINYIIGYIYFFVPLWAIWKVIYLKLYIAKPIPISKSHWLYHNQCFCINNFFLLTTNKQLGKDAFWHIISRVLSHYFIKIICKQKVELDNILFMSFLIKYIY